MNFSLQTTCLQPHPPIPPTHARIMLYTYRGIYMYIHVCFVYTHHVHVQLLCTSYIHVYTDVHIYIHVHAHIYIPKYAAWRGVRIAVQIGVGWFQQHSKNASNSSTQGMPCHDQLVVLQRKHVHVRITPVYM